MKHRTVTSAWLTVTAALVVAADGLAQTPAAPPAAPAEQGSFRLGGAAPPQGKSAPAPAPQPKAGQPPAGAGISVPTATIGWCLAPFVNRIAMFDRLAQTATWPKMTPAERQANYHTNLAVRYDVPPANEQRRFETRDRATAEEGWWLDTGHRLQLRTEYRLFDLVRLGPGIPPEGEVARRSLLQTCWISGPLSNWRWVGEAALDLPKAVPLSQFPPLAPGYQIQTSGKGEYLGLAWGDLTRGAPARVVFRFRTPLAGFTEAESVAIHLSDGPSPQRPAPPGAREMTRADFLKLLEAPAGFVLEGMPTRNPTDPDGKWDAKGAG